MTQTYDIPTWPYVYGGPSGRGVIRTLPEDFKVKERMSFEPSGFGEHAFLLVEKTGENTEYVARQLARFAGVRQRDIGYAGLKDRHAVTTQWFSVWLPGKQDPEWSELESDAVKVLQSVRHERKLKRGVLIGNNFQILIRDWQGDKERLVEQLIKIKTGGIPNYFGDQRFGLNGQNVDKALALFGGIRVKREQRSMYLSAARSFLFNQILARRVTDHTWNKALTGDALALAGSNSFFKWTEKDETIDSRIDACELHPTGVLWGAGQPDSGAEVLAFEHAVIKRFPVLAKGLIDQKVDMGRRSLRVNVEDLRWQFITDNQLQLNFNLPAGSFATALIREIIEI
ncbi:MAG: tRNA pseudouridine(13) synthase TruD [Gammaproteobacteria bacterium]